MRHLPPLALGVFVVIGSTAPVLAQDFPLEIDHRFGTATIPAHPERVATLDANGADNLLALGVQPVVIENWYGDYPRAVWPWAEPLLEQTPVILGRGDVNYELIASIEPDIVLSVWNDLTAGDYEQLINIAPVVAMPEGMGDYQLPWDEQALLTGRAVGRQALAEEKVDAIRARMAEIAASHPEWQGKTVTVAWATDDGSFGAYTSGDIRVQILTQLGFVNSPAIEAAAEEGAPSVRASAEARELLEADLLVWVSSTDDVSMIENVSARPYVSAHTDGREILFGKQVTGAFSHGTLLSLPFALDRLVPAIEAALDGDPATIPSRD